jgi:hypothetical protein
LLAWPWDDVKDGGCGELGFDHITKEGFHPKLGQYSHNKSQGKSHDSSMPLKEKKRKEKLRRQQNTPCIN